jgi:asparagine synthase (glutamine-hydrolysing)
MCGIAGFFGFSLDESARPVLRRMIGAIRHRGPDEEGIHVGKDFGFAHARLSIIDLSTGQQPMCNEDGSIWVTFNGEIFNHVELAEDLRVRGHQFRTRSDTETILHQYEEDGADCVESFNGDFAFAVHDERRGRLVLARDRMGVRPLYYTVRDQGIVFASEMKALFQFPEIRAEIDPIALDQVFTCWFPLAPRTPFKGIQELPPGHVLVAENGTIAVRRYWQLQYPELSKFEQNGRGSTASPTYDGRQEEDLAEELRELLIDATRLRLRSDVPVGAYLSGGLDSSVTTAAIRNFTSSQLRTFSVEFESEEFDEKSYQRAVVESLQTDHASVRVAAQDIGHLFPAVLWHAERPVIRTAPAPMFRLAKLVRENSFKVVMTGEGADEVLAGYDIFKEAKVRRFWARQPQSQTRPLLLRRLYPYLSGLQGQSQAYLSAFFKTGLDRPDDPFFSHLPRWEMTSRIKGFFAPDLRKDIGDYNALDELRSTLPPEFGRWHPLSQAQYLEAALLLPHYILSSQGDRVAMAHAVEGRFPFLDHRVVEFASRIPPRMKIRGLSEKHLLKKAMGRYLPAVVVDRPKQPYRAPEGESFFGPGAPDYVRELLSPAAIRRTGFFDAGSVDRLVSKCGSGIPLGFRDNMAIVGILSVQLLDQFFVRAAGAALQPVCAV